MEEKEEEEESAYSSSVLFYGVPTDENAGKHWGSMTMRREKHSFLKKGM